MEDSNPLSFLSHFFKKCVHCFGFVYQGFDLQKFEGFMRSNWSTISLLPLQIQVIKGLFLSLDQRNIKLYFLLVLLWSSLKHLNI